MSQTTPSRIGLVVVDLQNDFLAPEGAYARGQTVSQAGAQVLGPIAAELAYGEGLQAHARAAEMRLHSVPSMRVGK